MRKIQNERGYDKKVRKSKMQRVPKHSNTFNVGNNRSMLRSLLDGLETRTKSEDDSGEGKDNNRELPVEVTADFTRSLPFRNRMRCLEERVKWLKRQRKQDKNNLRNQSEIIRRFEWTKKGLCHNCSEHNPIFNEKRGICKTCSDKEKERWRKNHEKKKKLLRLRKNNKRRNTQQQRTNGRQRNI